MDKIERIDDNSDRLVVSVTNGLPTEIDRAVLMPHLTLWSIVYHKYLLANPKSSKKTSPIPADSIDGLNL